MIIINLDHFFRPRAVAVIGASRDELAAGHGVFKSLLRGGVFDSPTNKPFKGNVYPVNIKADEILGVKCHKNITEIEEPIDLAVIVVPAKIVPNIIELCAKKGVKAVIVISAGFGELGEEGEKLQREMVDVADKTGIRIIGPNCLGIMRPSDSLNASFGPCMPLEGNVAFFSQSGALVDSIIDWSLEKDYGFSSIISYGNSADLDVCDFIEWAAKDEKTKSIALYIEGLKDGKRFIDVAKKVSKIKPIVALKSGKSESGSKAVSSHTGSLAGSARIYEAAFLKAGVSSANSVEELFDLAKVLADMPATDKNSIAIITNGGGAGVLCTDHCEKFGIDLVELSEKTLVKLDESGTMHPAYSRRNPLDIVGDATSERYEVAITTVLEDNSVGGIIVIQTLQTMTDSVRNAKAVVTAHKNFPDKPIVACFMGGKFSKKGTDILLENHIPQYNSPYEAAKVMKALIDRGNSCN